MSASTTPEHSLAVVKPDHLGDFLLGLPALRALHARFGAFDLHLAPSNEFLADRYLPEDIARRPTTLSYLSRGKGGLSSRQLAERLAPYAAVVLLRSDLTSPALRRFVGRGLYEMPDAPDVHETALQRAAVRPLTGEYSRRRMVWGDEPLAWPTHIRTVGLSLGAGFTSNKLPLVYWIELAQRLRSDHGIDVRLTGGPLERTELKMAAKRLGLGSDGVFVGSADLEAYEAELATCDLVVGADSGNLHLASMTRPVLGVFTSSSWRRFAPMGPHVRILFSDVPCSPCIQYSMVAYNACTWRECAGVITADHLVTAITAPPGEGIVRLSSTVAIGFAPYELSSRPSGPEGVATPVAIQHHAR